MPTFIVLEKETDLERLAGADLLNRTDEAGVDVAGLQHGRFGSPQVRNDEEQKSEQVQEFGIWRHGNQERVKMGCAQRRVDEGERRERGGLFPDGWQLALPEGTRQRSRSVMEGTLSLSPEVVLRVLRPSEAGTVFSLVERNREHLRQWLPWVDQMNSVGRERAFLEVSYRGYLRRGAFQFGIWFQGRLAGMIGFHGFDPVNRVTSLGYWLGAEFCGKGIMRLAVRGAVDYAFSQRGMNRLFIRVATGNARSRRIAEALGFVHEGVQREAEWLYDHFVDLDVFSILAREWREKARIVADPG